MALRQAIAEQVVAIFNDPARGEAPVGRSDDSLFGAQSMAWRVHGDVTSMMVGGIASLMMQMLMPAVLAGVWDHSKFRADMDGRLRRTARFIATTTYGSRQSAEAAIDRVRRIHDAVEGVLPDGTPYRANDPRALAWVHVTEVTSFLAAWRRYGEPALSRIDADRYFSETARIGLALGANPVPNTMREAEMLLESMRREASGDARSREVLALILADRAADPRVRAVGTLIRAAAIDLLPRWARDLHGLSSPLLGRPLVRSGTLAVAETIRWSLRRPAPARG